MSLTQGFAMLAILLAVGCEGSPASPAVEHFDSHRYLPGNHLTCRFRLPSTIDRRSLTLQVRRVESRRDPRFSVSYPTLLTTKPPTAEASEVISTAWLSPLLADDEPIVGVTLRTDPLATRGEFASEAADISGGLTIGGSTAHLASADDFVKGKNFGWSPQQSQSWTDGELCLLRARSHDASTIYDYYVVAVIGRPR